MPIKPFMSVKIETGIAKRPMWLKGPTEAPSLGQPVGPEAKKSVLEIPPLVVDPTQFPELMAMFATHGSLQRKRRRLKTLSGQNARLLLAKNTVGAADNRGNVYLGVEFLKEFGQNDELVASVMAHEWGHLLSDLSRYQNVDHLTWEEIYQIRREEEAAADAFCGRMISQLGYKPDSIIEFLKKADLHSPTVKYYAAPIRAAIILEGYTLQEDRSTVARKIFTKKSYHNPYLSKLLQA